MTDAYDPGAYSGSFRYGPIKEPVDVLTASHEHPDHFSPKSVPGHPIIIKGPGLFIANGIEFRGTSTLHDAVGGEERGRNVVFTFTVDGIKICHLGDLGHVLTPEQAVEIGAVDVLLAPVGGYFTIDADEAWQVAAQLAAKIVIPMHFKTEKVDFPIAGVEEFIKDKPNVRILDASTVEIKKDQLPREREIILLRHAL